ncbi:unnamed protein product [Haemonchus placei]|uniref:PAP2_C domain-containing protein n=1 Tax=Haemonchus placei TaxID=6290 RepID=A0A0N4WFU3_HAEPC|nr:unnamed protein product [Haemonchus placei]
MQSYTVASTKCTCPSRVVIEQRCYCRGTQDETFTIHIPLQHMNEREYKPERFKTLLVMISFLIVGLINHFVLAVVTDIISQLPLPDFAHSIIPQNDFLRHMGDFFTAAAAFLLILICCVFHKHRWIVTRRLCYILTVLYMMRAISICLTHIPSGFQESENPFVFSSILLEMKYKVLNSLGHISVPTDLRAAAQSHLLTTAFDGVRPPFAGSLIL